MRRKPLLHLSGRGKRPRFMCTTSLCHCLHLLLATPSRTFDIDYSGKHEPYVAGARYDSRGPPQEPKQQEHRHDCFCAVGAAAIPCTIFPSLRPAHQEPANPSHTRPKEHTADEKSALAKLLHISWECKGGCRHVPTCDALAAHKRLSESEKGFDVLTLKGYSSACLMPDVQRFNTRGHYTWLAN